MKTRLYTRKRALISSVAMLLVAMIALGTATFAWFVADPTAKADGLQMKTTTSTGLVIDTQYDGNDTFSHEEKLNVQRTANGTSPYSAKVAMSPASMNSSGVMKTVDANASNNYVGKAGATISTLSDASTYYTETITAKTTDGSASAITKAKVTFSEAASAPTIKSAFRVALLSGTTVLATWAPAANANAKYIQDEETYPANGNLTSKRSLVATGTQQEINVSIAENSTATLTLVAYLDGEDGTCFSDNASLADCFSNVELWLSL